MVFDNDCKYALFKCHFKEGDSMEERPSNLSDIVDGLSPEAQSLEAHPAEPQSPETHLIHGVYWLNDSCIAVVLSDRHDAHRTRILAVGLSAPSHAAQYPRRHRLAAAPPRPFRPRLPAGGGRSPDLHDALGLSAAPEHVARVDNPFPPSHREAVRRVSRLLRLRLPSLPAG